MEIIYTVMLIALILLSITILLVKQDLEDTQEKLTTLIEDYATYGMNQQTRNDVLKYEYNKEIRILNHRLTCIEQQLERDK